MRRLIKGRVSYLMVAALAGVSVMLAACSSSVPASPASVLGTSTTVTVAAVQPTGAAQPAQIPQSTATSRAANPTPATIIALSSPEAQPSPAGAASMPTAVPAAASEVVEIGQRAKTSGCQVDGALPDSQCTPGAVFAGVTAAQVCVAGYSTSVRNVPESEKDAVYAEYGITSHTTGQYEVDHLISLELGGSNDIANLWPEAADPQPGFHQKDQVENYLHREVCSGADSLQDAQREIASDWLTVYQSMAGAGSVPVTIPAPTAAATSTRPSLPAAGNPGIQSETPEGNWVTSSYRTAKNYYAASDPRWKQLSPRYRVWFDTKEDLLAAYPDRRPVP